MVNRPPPITKPQPFSVGVFSCLIAPTPACSWGLLREPADLSLVGALKLKSCMTKIAIRVGPLVLELREMGEESPSREPRARYSCSKSEIAPTRLQGL